MPDWVLTILLLHSVFTSLLVAGGLLIVQVAVEVRQNAKLRRLKYVETGLWVVCKPLFDPREYHLFLSHACASSACHRARLLHDSEASATSNLEWQGHPHRTECAPSKRACSSVCHRAAPSSTSTANLSGGTP
jgi:hypothetical protein